jgi:hypothetical protein
MTSNPSAAWNGVDRRRRRAIAAAVRRGQALTDPREAAAAARHARQLRQSYERIRAIRFVVRLVVGAYVSAEVAWALAHGGDRGPTAGAVVALGVVAVDAGGFIRRAERRRRIRDAEQLNRQLAEALGVDVPDEESRPGTGRLWVLGTHVAALASFASLSSLTALGPHGPGSRGAHWIVGCAGTAGCLVAAAAAWMGFRVWRRTRGAARWLPLPGVTLALLVVLVWAPIALIVLLRGWR